MGNNILKPLTGVQLIWPVLLNPKSQRRVAGLQHPREVHIRCNLFYFVVFILKRQVNNIHNVVQNTEVLQKALPLDQGLTFNFFQHV